MKMRNILSIVITLIMLSSVVSAVEIRGTVSDNKSLLSWNAQNFAGFYYDIDNGLSSEMLNITVINDRTIPEGNLIYKTTKIPVNFSYSDDKNRPVIENMMSYDLVGWQAEKWVALNGKANKLVKLITEFKGYDKVTLTSGGTLTLGNGYVLKINSVDAHASPRQAWVAVMKDGKVLDDAILRQDEIYNLQKDVGGERNALVLSAYISSIFSGTESEMIQLKYIWLIDESTFTEVKSGSNYGIFDASISGNTITLKNDGVISLSKDSIVDLMGNMKFKIADSDTLRFYPFVDITEQIIKDVNPANVTSTITAIPCAPQIVEKNVTTEKIVYVNVTQEPTPTPKTPGFESILAIVGLIIVSILILRKKK